MPLFEGVLINVHPISLLFQFLVHLPLVDHLFGGVVEPPELQVKVIAKFIEHKVNLHIFAQDQEPRLILVSLHCGQVADVWTLDGFELAHQVLRCAVQVASAEAARHDGVRLLAVAKLVQLDDLNVFHLVNFTVADQLRNSWQFALGKKNFIVTFRLFFVDLGAESPHEILLGSFDQSG